MMMRTLRVGVSVQQLVKVFVFLGAFSCFVIVTSTTAATTMRLCAAPKLPQAL